MGRINEVLWCVNFIVSEVAAIWGDQFQTHPTLVLEFESIGICLHLDFKSRPGV